MKNLRLLPQSPAGTLTPAERKAIALAAQAACNPSSRLRRAGSICRDPQGRYSARSELHSSDALDRRRPGAHLHLPQRCFL
eukprot:4460753-Prymnesium_polylepis.2